MMQALGAMLRGESAQDFLKDLAKTNPQLQALDLDHPEKASEDLCKKEGIDHENAKSGLLEKLSQLVSTK